MVRDRMAAKAVEDAMFSAPRTMTVPVDTNSDVTGIWLLFPRRPNAVENGVPPSRANAQRMRDVAVRRPKVAKEAEMMMVEVIALAAAAQLAGTVTHALPMLGHVPGWLYASAQPFLLRFDAIFDAAVVAVRDGPHHNRGRSDAQKP